MERMKAAGGKEENLQFEEREEYGELHNDDIAIVEVSE